MTGKFITIEGCEGVGKSTLTAKLKKYFEECGISAVFTREPGGTPVAEKVRGIILDADNAAITPVTELLLYAACRAQHTEELIIPALSEGKIVVCDRYSDSTLAYQGYGRGLDKELCRALNGIAERGVKINLTVFLNLDPEQGFKRKGGAQKSDRLEREELEFHKRVYTGFKEIAEGNPERYAVIDARQSGDKVFESVLDAMRERGIIG